MSDAVLKRENENLEETCDEGEKKRRKVDNDSVIIGPSLPVSLPQENSEENTSIKSDKRKITPKILQNVAALPEAKIYEVSYMHKDTVCNVKFAKKTDFLITGSKDGHVKFWKKQATSIEFVKDFLAHQGNICEFLTAYVLLCYALLYFREYH